RALRWKMILQPIQIYPKTKNVVYAVLIGYIANVIVPRMGEIAKCTVLAKYEKVPADKVIGTIIAERAFDVLCFGILLLLTLAFQFHIIAPYALQILHHLFMDEWGNFLWTRIIILSVLALLAILFLIIFYNKS